MSNTNGTTRPDLNQIWKVLNPLLQDSWTPPISVKIHPSRIAVSVQFPDNDRNAVLAAYAELGIGAIPKLDLSYRWFEGEPNEFVVYGSFRHNDELAHPELPNVGLGIYCHIETRVDASAHWDGLILHPAMAVA